MKDIIKSIEDAQLKPEVDSFRVGDTVRVSVHVSVSRYLKELLLRDRTVEQKKLSQ